MQGNPFNGSIVLEIVVEFLHEHWRVGDFDVISASEANPFWWSSTPKGEKAIIYIRKNEREYCVRYDHVKLELVELVETIAKFGRVKQACVREEYTIDWQAYLAINYGKSYVEYFRRIRQDEYEKLKSDYRRKLYEFAIETDRMINDIKITAWPISERK